MAGFEDFRQGCFTLDGNGAVQDLTGGDTYSWWADAMGGTDGRGWIAQRGTSWLADPGVSSLLQVDLEGCSVLDSWDTALPPFSVVEL